MIMEHKYQFSTQREFKIDDYISLKLEWDENKERHETVIYIKDERFQQCKYLFIIMPTDGSDKKLNSIDEAKEIYSNKMEGNLFKPEDFGLTAEDVFWGHCSNLQAWAENNYDTRLIDSSLAFPILKRLTDLNAPQAKTKLKEEIINRFNSGYPSSMLFLINEDYLSCLNNQDRDNLMDIFLIQINEDRFDLSNEDIFEIVKSLTKKYNRKDLKKYIKEVFLQDHAKFGYLITDYLSLLDKDELIKLLNKSIFREMCTIDPELKKLYREVLQKYLNIKSIDRYSYLSNEGVNSKQKSFFMSLLSVIFEGTYSAMEKKVELKKLLSSKFYSDYL